MKFVHVGKGDDEGRGMGESKRRSVKMDWNWLGMDRQKDDEERRMREGERGRERGRRNGEKSIQGTRRG